jgi:hypothetical protein
MPQFEERADGASQLPVVSPMLTSSKYRECGQINKRGGSVRKAEKSTPMVLWSIYVDGVEVMAGD